jgi:hypothetical protein
LNLFDQERLLTQLVDALLKLKLHLKGIQIIHQLVNALVCRVHHLSQVPDKRLPAINDEPEAKADG